MMLDLAPKSQPLAELGLWPFLATVSQIVVYNHNSSLDRRRSHFVWQHPQPPE
jgi:hypothetical protein